MHRPFRLAGERLLALAAALAAVTGSTPATAQEDPFALPRDLTAQSALAAATGPGLSEISVDGEIRPRMVNLAWQPGGVLAIDAVAARAAGLPVPDSSGAMIPLGTLKLAKWTFDQVHQRLVVELMRQSDGANLIDLAQPPDRRGETRALTSLRVDYDMTATLARGRTEAAGLIAGALVRGNVALNSGFQVASASAPGTLHLLRLDTQLQILFPRKGLTLTAGDFVSAGGQSQRALRLGGVQIASDYSLRPDLITSPLPSFTGQVAVPTGVDLIQGDQRYKLGEVQPGEFTVRNVPTNAGRGEIAVVLRDSLGREVIQTARYYTSRNLLARNLSEFAVNFGFVRRRYGVLSNSYGPLAGSAYYRRGLSSRVTIEGTAEWTSGLLNAGARGDVVLKDVVLLSAEGRYSRDSDGKTGTLLNIGLESTGRRLSGRIGAILPSANYRDSASKLGDPSPPRQYVAQLSFDLWHMNQFQLAAARQERRYDPRFPAYERRSDAINANFRTQIRRNIDLFSSVGYRSGQSGGYSAFAGLSVQLGGGRQFQGSVTGGSNARLLGSTMISKQDIEADSLGYRFERLYGAVDRTAAALAWRSQYGRLETLAERVNGQMSFRANARGSLIAAGGTVFARNQTGGSYALVRAGRVGGVTIMRENRPAGVTAKNGLLLVENIPAQVPIGFDVDADKLPVDALARDVKKRVIVPRRAVGLVELDVIRFVPRQIRLIASDGNPVAAGTVFKALPSGEIGMVGFDGVTDFNAGGSDRRLLVGSVEGVQCLAEVDPGKVAQVSDPEHLPAIDCPAAVPGTLAALAAEPGHGRKPRRHAAGGHALAQRNRR